MFNATRSCELLVGLPDVTVIEILEPVVGRLEVRVESIVVTPRCVECGERARVKDRPILELVDLTCFGRPVTLRWPPNFVAAPSGHRFLAEAGVEIIELPDVAAGGETL